MFIDSKSLKGMVIRATDGELGKVDQLYFDDNSWAIRYLTVETGGWLGGRQVLISPYSVRNISHQEKCIDVYLTKKQVEDSPNIDTHMPVSRQHEAAYLGYYGYPFYWDGPYTWGSAYYPSGMSVSEFDSPGAIAARARTHSSDSHLRSSEVVSGYHIEASDGELGHIDRFIVDDHAWSIRYLEVATQNWWPGKKVLISPAWVERVSWEKSLVYVALTRESIKTAPAYTEATPLTREFENSLYLHYGRPPYWLNEALKEPALAFSR